ncbi:MAG: bifunctional folylpolyglutamate synthase/dihydrofolate synthase [Deltaproteobacteria bacterium]|nr:bifunctional folylpolyglutamate synthase/dihydrofolate synthase [Deltaproteobacteria bacterium]
MPTLSPYNKTMEYLYSLERLGIHLGLARMKAILKSLDNPQDKLNIIHVGGTNGKGSTSAMIESILMKTGYKVGLYTSPHLFRFNERIRVNGREIPDRKIAELVERIRQRVEAKVEAKAKAKESPNLSLNLTFFEFTTAMAFLYFAEEKVDIAVMEVGLGGRLDATNVGKPLVSVITNIAKDHESILGGRISDIAFEKAGIIKRGGILISGETKPAALKVLNSACKKKGAVFYRLDRDFFIEQWSNGATEQRRNRKADSSAPSLGWVPPRFPDSLTFHLSPFTFTGRRWVYKNLQINLLGRHQHLNAACALAAAEVLEEKGYTIPEIAVRKGLASVYWPGRLEIVSRRPLIVLDCAHNPAGAEVLREALLDLRFTIYELRIPPPLSPSGGGQGEENRKSKIVNHKLYKRLFLVLGIMADKDIKGIVLKLAPLAHTVILTRPKTERAASLEMLYQEIMELRITNYDLRIEGTTPLPPLIRGNNRKSKILNRKLKIMLIEDVADACRTTVSMANADDIICVSGSVFTVGEAREAFRQLQIENCKVQNIKLKKGKP